MIVVVVVVVVVLVVVIISTNSLDPDPRTDTNILLGLISVQTVCKGYKQMIKVTVRKKRVKET